jgi:hypothetical protein
LEASGLLAAACGTQDAAESCRGGAGVVASGDALRPRIRRGAQLEFGPLGAGVIVGWLRRYLRELRNKQRLTVRTAAEKLEWSEAKICRIYGTPAHLTEALMGLAKETKAKGGWQAYGDVVPE